MKTMTWLAISGLTTAAAMAACSSSTSTGGGTQATSDGGTGGQTASTTSTSTTSSISTMSSGSTTSSGSSSTTSSSSGSNDGGTGMVNGCDAATTTVSAGNVTVTFPGSPFAYTPSCIKVHAGAKVTWNGDFTVHPLTPEGTNNPITLTSQGTSVAFTFANDGSFGFHCANHPSMIGAVFVVP